MGNFITMPKLGMTMAEGTIVKWLVEEGTAIEKGDFIFETETDKTSLEVDSLYAGTLLKIYAKAGDVVPVNDPVAYIGETGETIPERPSNGSVKTVETPPREQNTVNITAEKEPDKQAFPLADQNSSNSYDYDLIVIGAGPGGYVAAIRAAQLGAKVAVVEKDAVGGTCLNKGCIPVKSLYASAKRYKEMQSAGELGIHCAGITFDWNEIISRKDKIVGKLASGVASLLKKNNVELIEGMATVEKAHQVIVDKREYTCKYILIATGSKPATVLKSEAIITDTDKLLNLNGLPGSIAIIGGGVIGCEIAGIFNALGVKTTIIEMTPRILPMVDEEVSTLLYQRMEKNGIKILAGTTCNSIQYSGKKYILTLSGGQALNCDLVLEAVGRKADVSAFEKLGVELSSKGTVVVDKLMRTSIESVYAIGDVNGLFQLAHAASEQGIVAVEHMFENRAEAEPQPMPSCIFTDIEIAYVGLTEEEAKEKGFPIRAFKFPYSANGKAQTLGAEEGFVKVITDKRWGEILGVHIIGAEASSLIEEAVMAMRCEATVQAAGKTIHPHPTLSETLMEAFLGASTGAIHY